MRLIKATVQEKKDYLLTKPVYPLSHWVTVGGHKCAVEDLRCWPKGDPQYEVMSPKGFHFTEGNEISCAGSLHSLLCLTLADVRQRVSYVTCSPCTEGGEDEDESPLTD